MTDSLKELVESSDCGCHEVSGLSQKWENRFTHQNPRLIDRYVEGEMGIVAILSRGVGHYDCAVFYNLGNVGKCIHPSTADPFNNFSGARRKATAHAGHPLCIHPPSGCQCGQDGPVFIDDVQLVDHPEGVVRSLVWTTTTYFLFSAVPGALYLMGNKRLQMFGAVSDRKSSEVGRRVSCLFNECISNVVQGRPEVVKGIANHSAQYQGGVPQDAETPLESPLWAVLADDYVGVGIKEGFDADIEIGDVLVGPLNL